ncbi:MAG: hypothetical protein ACK4GT_08905, partial [Pararhodobacter sp.]
MFDWDTDYEGVVESRVLCVHERAAPATASLRQRLTGGLGGLAGRCVMAGVVALGLAGAALVTVPGAPVPVFAMLVSWPAQAPAMPDGLHAYDHSQFINFHRGIARFSDADLLNYARETERTLAGDNPMAAFTRDALFLTHGE